METDTIFSGSIPAIYDRFLGPLIFEPYAQDLARRLGGVRGGRLLETAAGTGIVTRALAAALPETVRIDATDINQTMVDYAARLPRPPNVEWGREDAEALPFPDATFAMVVCQFGVMFFPDIVKGFSEARRVLRPGGRFLFNVWDRIEANDFAHVTTEAVGALFPEDPPRFLARVPHGHHETGVIEARLRRAGFGEIEIETVAKESVAASARDPAIGYCQGTPMRNEIEARDPTRLEEATDAAQAAIAERFGSGSVKGRISAHVFTARR
jgi:ubiquinone/menaquinone biosynthesis C-methylase UbiE